MMKESAKKRQRLRAKTVHHVFSFRIQWLNFNFFGRHICQRAAFVHSICVSLSWGVSFPESQIFPLLKFYQKHACPCTFSMMGCCVLHNITMPLLTYSLLQFRLCAAANSYSVSIGAQESRESCNTKYCVWCTRDKYPDPQGPQSIRLLSHRWASVAAGLLFHTLNSLGFIFALFFVLYCF